MSCPLIYASFWWKFWKLYAWLLFPCFLYSADHLIILPSSYDVILLFNSYTLISGIVITHIHVTATQVQTLHHKVLYTHIFLTIAHQKCEVQTQHITQVSFKPYNIYIMFAFTKWTDTLLAYLRFHAMPYSQAVNEHVRHNMIIFECITHTHAFAHARAQEKFVLNLWRC